MRDVSSFKFRIYLKIFLKERRNLIEVLWLDWVVGEALRSLSELEETFSIHIVWGRTLNIRIFEGVGGWVVLLYFALRSWFTHFWSNWWELSGRCRVGPRRTKQSGAFHLWAFIIQTDLTHFVVAQAAHELGLLATYSLLLVHLEGS